MRYKTEEDTSGASAKGKEGGIDRAGHAEILKIIDREQDSGWRRERDKDEDFIHFRQRDSAALQMLEHRGIKVKPIDNFIGKACRDAVAVLAENKKDARLIANPNLSPELADAISEKLKVAEDESFCDRQGLDAGYKQAGVGISWLEVHRNSNILSNPYKISEAPRNELFRDESVPLAEYEDGQWMYQRKYVHWEMASALWPDKAAEIKDVFESGGSYDWQPTEGGQSTGLVSSTDDYEFWTTEEKRWLDRDSGLISVGVAHTKSVRHGLVLVGKDSSIPFDKENEYHVEMVISGESELVEAPIVEMHRTFFAGPLKLGSELVESGKFPYVPFYYFIDGRTGFPYGISRFMMSLQEEHNARSANDLWNLGSMRIKMTEDAVAMPIDEFRSGVSRPDFVCVLNRQEMQEGGVYEEKREFELSEEQYKRTQDLRVAMDEASGTVDAKEGSQGPSGNLDFVARGKSLSLLLANHEYSRMAVLERLLDFILEDSLEEEEVIIPARGMINERRIMINSPVGDGTIRNNVQEFRGKIRLEDVPSSPERTRSEMISLSEIAKSIKHEGMQNTIAPYVVSYSGIPDKNELAREMKESSSIPSEEDIQQRVDEAVKNALLEAKIEQGDRKLGQDDRKLDLQEASDAAEIDKKEAESDFLVIKGMVAKVEAIYSSMQGALAVVENKAIAPVGQQILDSSGFVDDDLAPVIGPMAAGPIAGQATAAAAPLPPQPEARQNTSPLLPPRTQSTSPSTIGQNTTERDPEPGVETGIEAQGNQVI